MRFDDDSLGHISVTPLPINSTLTRITDEDEAMVKIVISIHDVSTNNVSINHVFTLVLAGLVFLLILRLVVKNESKTDYMRFKGEQI